MHKFDIPRTKNGLIDEPHIDWDATSNMEKIIIEEELKKQHKMLDDIFGFSICDYITNYKIPDDIMESMISIKVPKFTKKVNPNSTTNYYDLFMFHFKDMLVDDDINNYIIYVNNEDVNYSRTFINILENFNVDPLNALKVEFYKEFLNSKYHMDDEILDYYLHSQIAKGIDNFIRINFLEKLDNYSYFKTRYELISYAGENISPKSKLDEINKAFDAYVYYIENIQAFSEARNTINKCIYKLYSLLKVDFLREYVIDKRVNDDPEMVKKVSEIFDRDRKEILSNGFDVTKK